MRPYNYLHVYCHSRAKIQRETARTEKQRNTQTNDEKCHLDTKYNTVSIHSCERPKRP